MTAKSKKIWGIVLIAAPFVLLITVLSSYAISSFIMASAVDAGAEATLASTVGTIVKAILSFLGIIAVLGFFVAIPAGIYFLATAGKDLNALKLPVPAFVSLSGLSMLLIILSIIQGLAQPLTLFMPSNTTQMLLAIVGTLVSLAAFITMVVWAYRAYKNVWAIGKEPGKYSLGFLPWSFFIPFVSLVMPVLYMYDLSKTTHALAGKSDKAFTVQYAWLSFIPWILTAVFFILSFVMVLTMYNIDQLFSILVGFYSFLMPITLALFVYLVNSEQEKIGGR